MISSKKKFLITGAGGFVGYHLTTYFSNLGHKVFASFRNKKPKFDNDKIKLVKLNLPYTSGLDFEYDSLIHCGADTTATTNNENDFINSNVIGSKKIFESAIKNGAKTIVNLSSMSIYGDIKTNYLKECNESINPDNYGVSKLEAETILAQLMKKNKSINAVSIRLPGVVGRGSHNNFLSRLLFDIIFEKEIIIKNPNPSDLFNNLIHVKDLSEYINFFVNADINEYRPVNIAASCPIPLSMVIQEIFNHIGKPNTAKFIREGKKSFQISIDNITKQGFNLRSTQEMLESFVTDIIKE